MAPPFPNPLAKKPPTGSVNKEVPSPGGGPDLSQSFIVTPPEPTNAAPNTESLSESLNVQLIDKMKRSVQEYGPFFIEVGPPDNQVLILKHGRKIPDKNDSHGSYSDFIAVTRQGAKIVAIPDYFVMNLRPGEEENSYTFNGTKLTLKSLLGDNSLTLREISSKEDQSFVKEAFSESMKKSRNISEAAKKKAAEDVEQRRKVAAKELLDFFNQLTTQPPAGEGLAAPPPTDPTG